MWPCCHPLLYPPERNNKCAQSLQPTFMLARGMVMLDGRLPPLPRATSSRLSTIFSVVSLSVLGCDFVSSLPSLAKCISPLKSIPRLPTSKSRAPLFLSRQAEVIEFSSSDTLSLAQQSNPTVGGHLRVIPATFSGSFDSCPIALFPAFTTPLRSRPPPKIAIVCSCP